MLGGLSYGNIPGAAAVSAKVRGSVPRAPITSLALVG